MFFRSPLPPNSRFGSALAAVLARRPALAREAAAYVLGHYRRHRRLPRGPASSLLTLPALAGLVTRGEIEHRCGLVRARRQAARWLNRPQRSGPPRLPSSPWWPWWPW